MKSLFVIGILTVILGTFIVPSIAYAEVGNAVTQALPKDKRPVEGRGIGGWVAEAIFTGIGHVLMFFSSLVLILTGWLLDEIVKFTIVDMAKNLGEAEGIGSAINEAWATLRDMANIVFIFVLLYAAFSAMFQLSFGNLSTTIRNIILVALLINFSLFFTKVVIDASNIVASGFYNSIVEANDSELVGSREIGGTANFKGISGGYMRMLGLQTWYGASILDCEGGCTLTWDRILVIGLLSSIFMFLASVIFLITAIMFAARFVILIFLMILSPLALIAIIIPGQSKKFDEWKGGLTSQALFAPVFFALTWVALKVGSKIVTILPDEKAEWIGLVQNVTTSRDSIALIVNYILVIGISIMALVTAKNIASKTSHFNALTGAMGIDRVAGVVGGVTLGSAAAVGRRTIGAGASRLAQSRRLQDWAARSKVGQWAKAGVEKTAQSSFDIRQTKTIGGVLQKNALGSFGAGKAGGYDATLQAQTAKKEKFAQSLRTDAQRQAYATRIANKWYVRGGSRPNHAPSIFGTMGRSNRIVASKVLSTQLNNLNSQRDSLQGRETSLTQQLSNMTNEWTTLNGIPAATRTGQQTDRFNQLNDVATRRGSLANVQDQLNTVQVQLANVTTLIGSAAAGTGIAGQIQNLGLTNPNNQIVNPVTGSSRDARADEQNY